MMTAYDYPNAKAVSDAEIDIILVGDSLAQVVLGHDDTLSVTVDEMLHHVKAVTNANPSSLVVADMPYLSYHINISDSLKNAGRFIQEGKADAVKVEGGEKRKEVIKALVYGSGEAGRQVVKAMQENKGTTNAIILIRCLRVFFCSSTNPIEIK